MLPIWRRYAKLRTQLYPYIAAASRDTSETGMPITRQLGSPIPATRAIRQQEELLFGPDLLAAPVVEEGATERELYLPEGRWIDFWRSVSYRPGSGASGLGGGGGAHRRPPGDAAGAARGDADAPARGRPAAAPAARRRHPRRAPRRAGDGPPARPRARAPAPCLPAWNLARQPRPRDGSSRGRAAPARLRSSSDSALEHGSTGRSRSRSPPCATRSSRAQVRLDGRPLPDRAWSFDGDAESLRARFEVRAGTLSVEGEPDGC